MDLKALTPDCVGSGVVLQLTSATAEGAMVVSSRQVPPRLCAPAVFVPGTELDLSSVGWHTTVCETNPAEKHLLLLQRDLATS